MWEKKRWKSLSSSAAGLALHVLPRAEHSTRGTAGLMLHTLVLCGNSLEKGISCPTDEPGLCCHSPPAKFIVLHKKFSPSCRCIHTLPGAWSKHTISISMLLAPFGPFLFPRHIHAFEAGGKQVNWPSQISLVTQGILFPGLGHTYPAML